MEGELRNIIRHQLHGAPHTMCENSASPGVPQDSVQKNTFHKHLQQKRTALAHMPHRGLGAGPNSHSNTIFLFSTNSSFPWHDTGDGAKALISKLGRSGVMEKKIDHKPLFPFCKIQGQTKARKGRRYELDKILKTGLD